MARALREHPALERAIAEAPYDEERWVVLEDWLLEQADPRGAIVLLEKAGRSDGATRVRRRLHPQLLGRDHAKLAAALYRADWRAGYVRECHFAAADVDALEALCRAPAAVLLRALTLTTPHARLADALGWIRDGVFADTLHDLTVSNAHAEPPVLAADLLAPLPRLRRLALRGAYVHPGEVARVERLVIAPTSYDLARLPPFLEGVRFPAATDVTLDLGNLAAPALDRATLALLFGTFAPGLARFAMRAATPAIAREVVTLLASSPLLPQLRELDLGAVDARHVVRRDHGDRFAHVRVTLPAAD